MLRGAFVGAWTGASWYGVGGDGSIGNGFNNPTITEEPFYSSGFNGEFILINGVYDPTIAMQARCLISPDRSCCRQRPCTLCAGVHAALGLAPDDHLLLSTHGQACPLQCRRRLLDGAHCRRQKLGPLRQHMQLPSPAWRAAPSCEERHVWVLMVKLL